MNYLEILQPATQEDVNGIRVTYTLVEGKKETMLWYKFPKQYAPYLTIEVADAVVIGILMYAMERGLGIKSETPISAGLYMKLTKYLMPFLSTINASLKSIQFDMPISENTYNGEHVGTGVSCGVDSLSTIICHGEEEYVNRYRIDTLTLLNTGYYGAHEDNSSNYKRYLNQSVDFCNEHSYSFFTLDSNISNITEYNFLSAHTYLTCSVILLFQKYFHTYYYSSGYPAYSFKPDFKDPAYYDIFLLDCISTESLKFISSCSTMSRVDKTALILNHPTISKHLYVCTGGNPPTNCCKCEKCVRTMLAIESLGKIKDITFNYDSSTYRKHRIQYFSYMLRHRHSNVYYREIYDSIKKNNISIPLLSWINIIPCRFELFHIAQKLHLMNIGRFIYRHFKKQS